MVTKVLKLFSCLYQQTKMSGFFVCICFNAFTEPLYFQKFMFQKNKAFFKYCEAGKLFLFFGTGPFNLLVFKVKGLILSLILSKNE